MIEMTLTAFMGVSLEIAKFVESEKIKSKSFENYRLLLEDAGGGVYKVHMCFIDD